VDIRKPYLLNEKLKSGCYTSRDIPVATASTPIAFKWIYRRHTWDQLFYALSIIVLVLFDFIGLRNDNLKLFTSFSFVWNDETTLIACPPTECNLMLFNPIYSPSISSRIHGDPQMMWHSVVLVQWRNDFGRNCCHISRAERKRHVGEVQLW
jgi:hypothetical protein